MNWADIWKIILAALASVGGIAGLIVLAIRFASNIIAERLSKKYELKLQKDMVLFKSALTKKEYVSKTRFDTEFALYRELSKTFAEMIKSINILIPVGYTTVPADHAERVALEKKHYEDALPAVVKAQDTLFANIPFISEPIYNAYGELLRLGQIQLGEYEERFVISDLRPQAEKECFSREAYARTRELNEKWKTQNAIVREYISTLDVMEDK